MDNVLYLKLTTGDDIVSEIAGEPNVHGDDYFSLKNPIKIFMTNDGLGMMPLAGYVKSDTIELKKEHVMYFGEPETELYDAYDQQFGSGLIRPKSNLQIVT